MKRIAVLLVLVILLAAAGCGVRQAQDVRNQGSGGAALTTLDGKPLSPADLEATIAQTMAKANVAGLSVAILNDGQIAYTHAFGYRDRAVRVAFDTETVTGAASLSKTVFAYLVMLLAEEGAIDLDTPLQAYLSRPLPEYPGYADLAGDDRYKLITARMALSHSTGFPNWRSFEPDKRLKFLFTPGARYSYSGEGYALLQMVVEQITGRDLETLARQKVFEPLGMTRTSYVWQKAFEGNVAQAHDQYGRTQRVLQLALRRSKPDAAGSMVTTAGDYARFLTAILNATGQPKATMDEMLRPQIAISSEQMFGPGAWQQTNKYQQIGLAWALGWGRFDSEQGPAFFHTGHDLGYQNYTVTYPDRGIGIVLLSNSDNFESVAREIAEAAIGDRASPWDWLGYAPFDPSKVKTPPPEPVAIDVAPEILQGYVGAYQLVADPNVVLQFKLEDGRLYSSSDGQQWNQRYAESETRFFVQVEDTRVVFVGDAAGMVTGFNLEMSGLVLPARKVT
jgi:CubicO group peptidase (beta-lactamase class C family)